MSTDDPPHPDGFGGSDEESHYMSSKQGLSEYDRIAGRLIRSGVSPEDTKRAMDKAGITLEEARELRDRIFARFPELKETIKMLRTVEEFGEHFGAIEIDPKESEAKVSNWLQQRQEELNNWLSRVGVHVLKTWPEYFEAVYFGDKTFEVRFDDRDYKVGDTLVLREWDPKTKEYSGRQLEVRVTYLMKDDKFGFLKPGAIVMGIKKNE